jgi:hypothetical protein
MATTDAKPGFRLPWSSDRSESANPADVAQDSATGEASPPQQEIETPEMIDAAPAASDHEAVVETPVASDPSTSTAGPARASAAAPVPAASAARKPNKFMADLTKAMQVAAETAREDTLGRFNAEAKTHIEGIHAASATEATELRKKADDDISGIRDWSKAEIARIREETDERITHRKGTLDAEIEEHAAFIETRIERVQARVTAFESEMAAFFERLLAEDDPTRFAAMAESLPEPPPFDGPVPERDPAWYTTPAVEKTAEPVVEAVVVEAEPVEAAPVAEPAAEAVETIEAVAAPIEPDPAWGAPEAAPSEAAPAVAAAEAFPAEPSWSTETEAPAEVEADAPADDADPRLSVLGLTPDFAAAEAEAARYAANDESGDDEMPEIADDAIAARLAGLVPEGEPSAEVVTTRVVVTGLISVASIAGFKRHLSRATGVQSVGVSSGPDGEFVFAVGHGSDVALRDVIPALPGFAARVTAEGDGELTVAARDPEAES